MDHGKLTDHNGKQINFRNMILIMTTNAGARKWPSPPRLHPRQARRRGRGGDQPHVRPEFRNRLDAIVPFGRLPTEVIAKVVDKFVMQLEAQLADRHVQIELSDEARAWLVERGYDEAMGARPMARVIQTFIKTPLADEVLFGRLKTGGTVRVVVSGEGWISNWLSSSPTARSCHNPTRKWSRRARRKPRPRRRKKWEGGRRQATQRQVGGMAKITK